VLGAGAGQEVLGMTRTLTAILVLVTASAAVWAQPDPTAITPFSSVADTSKPVGPPPAAVTAIIFRTSCGRCHGSDRPAIGLSLRRENFAAATIDVPSKEVEELKLVDTKDPQKSYLLMKLRGDEGIIGERMPIGAAALNENAIAAIEAWIREVAAAAAADTAAVAEPESLRAPAGRDAANQAELRVRLTTPGPPRTARRASSMPPWSDRPAPRATNARIPHPRSIGTGWPEGAQSA
jgi:cytochrome c553